ncbi:MAG: caspase domain-containing protein [Steroidobacterales bacterium]
MSLRRNTVSCCAPALWVTALLMLAAAAPVAAHRLALVIGNDSYEHAQALRNARADARAIAAVLQGLGYTVTLKQDVNLQQMKQALRAFKAQVAGGDEVVFYFSGHGVQFGGTNYLIPVDLVPQNEEQVADDSVGLQRVLDDLSEQKARFSLAIIDACRDNPFKGSGRAIGKRGLAPVTAATGEMVLYSAGAGQEALDRLGSQDNDPNGLFTRILIKEIRKPGVPANQVLKNVSYQVVQLAKSVNHDQVPALYDQTIGDYFFVPPGHAAPPPAAPSATASTIHVQTSDELEQSFWDRIRESTDPQDYADYKKQFPQGAHAGEAALQLRRLKRAAAPKTAPVARSADLAGGAAAPPAAGPAAMPAAATSASARAGPAAPVPAGTYPGYTTSSLNPGMVLRGRIVLASNGDFEYTGSTGVKVRGSLNLSRPQQIEGAGTVTQPKRFGIPLLHYPDGSTTANMVIRGEIVNGTLRGRYSDAYETGELIFDLNSPM